jgi:hypothetical protein
MSALEPQKYLADQSLAATFSGKPINTQKLSRLSFTAEWSAFAATAGAFTVEESDDPRVEQDILRGTSTAKWTTKTLPTTPGAVDGTNIVVAATTITINASAGQFSLILTDPNLSGWLRLTYTRAGGGTAAQLQAYVSGRGAKT